MEDVTSLAQWTNEQFDPALNWKDVEWIKKVWPGKLIIKGILDVEDAKTAVKLGADAVVVSNHGGRQLDGAPSSISALPAIAQAVGSDTEVMFDGGIRTGADVLRALALGARACMIGRAFVYGLGARGKEASPRRSTSLRRSSASRWRSPAPRASPISAHKCWWTARRQSRRASAKQTTASLPSVRRPVRSP
jgi:isopentenyl diphosphate isomerase/L-lactate dehydrogenase-like FMN-dependent dehydrogenase